MKFERKNILVVTYWSFDDPLIQTYTLPYLEIMLKKLHVGSTITLVTFERGINLKRENINPSIKHLQLKYYSSGIFAFFAWLKNIFVLYFHMRKNKYTHIHAWCTTGGMLAYILSKLTNIDLVIDSFEPHAEAMVENGSWKRQGLKYNVLFYFERLMAHHAKQLIGIATEMERYAEIKYGLIDKKIFLKPACVDLNHFNLDKIKNERLIRELDLENKIVCVYAGKFGGIYLSEEIFEFFEVCFEVFGDKFHVLLLTKHKLDEIKKLNINTKMDMKKFTIKYVEHNQIANYIGVGDFAVTPVKPIPTKRYCSPIKDGEYWALGLPVIITNNISDDSNIISENSIGAVINSLDRVGYQQAAIKMKNLLQNGNRTELRLKVRSMAERFRNFQIADRVYEEIYTEFIQ